MDENSSQQEQQNLHNTNISQLTKNKVKQQRKIDTDDEISVQLSKSFLPRNKFEEVTISLVISVTMNIGFNGLNTKISLYNCLKN